MQNAPLNPAALDAPALAAAEDDAPGRLADFYELTKPRLNFLVLVTTFVGFYVAARVAGVELLDWRLAHALLGTAFVAASAATLNQVVERDLDARMRRTRDRPVAAGRLSAGEATAFGITLGAVGLVELAVYTNALTAALGVLTWAIYLFAYTPLKTRSPLNTLVGAITGALPPAMGVTAVTGAVTPLAGALFALLFVWQMPHFFALALMYQGDYAAGGFKMLPNAPDGDRRTRTQALAFAAMLLPISLLPVVPGVSRAGWGYGIAATILGLFFIRDAVRCARRVPRGERRLFFASIVYLPLVLGALMADQ